MAPSTSTFLMRTRQLGTGPRRCEKCSHTYNGCPVYLGNVRGMLAVLMGDKTELVDLCPSCETVTTKEEALGIKLADSLIKVMG